MRVLLVAHHLPPRHRAGVEVHTLRLAHALQEHDCEVALYATDDDPLRQAWSVAEESIEGIRCWRLAQARVAEQPSESLGGANEHAAFERVLDAVRPEVVHFQHLMQVGVDAPLHVARRGVPALLTLHEYWLLCARGGQMRQADGVLCARADAETCARCLCTHRFGRSGAEVRIARWCERLRRISGIDGFALLKRLAEKRGRAIHDSVPPSPVEAEVARMRTFVAARQARVLASLHSCQRLLCPSRFLRNQFVEAFPELERRLLYWPNGVPLSEGVAADSGGADHESTAPPAPLRVGFLGSIIPEKGVDVLVRAFAALPSGLAALCIHGNSRLRPRYAAALRAQAGASVQWAGVFTGSSQTALAQLDVLVVPSVWYENAPLVITEAMAAGVPVVASDLGGMRELVQHESNGLLFPMGDAAALAQCLQRLALDRRLLRRLSAAAAPIRSVAAEAAASVALYRELRSE